MNSFLARNRNDIEIKKNRIRFYFYIGTIVPIFLFMLVFSLTIINGIKNEHIANFEQLSDTILAEKKLFIKNSVEQTIHILGRIKAEQEANGLFSELTVPQQKEVIGNRLRGYIHSLRFVDKDQYVWVNEIIDFDGGEDYAIRLIHPSLPETEGDFLSTNFEDIKGNKPYEIELKGVIESGNVFSHYYFKEMNSNQVSKKLSYAQLYRPFNWVIATGIYLEDVETYVGRERQKLDVVFEKQKKFSVVLIAISLFFSMILIYLFERNISRLVHSYEKEIKVYTRELEILSTTDRLTGLSNRLFLDGILDQELAKAKRYKKEFSIILLDLDRFKSVNDSHGHLEGDVVLVELSGLLIKNTRNSDVVGRWGGEEFLIICMETELEGAIQHAEHLRVKISEFEFSSIGHMSGSFGVACFHEDDTTDSLIERADGGLYKAKARGRNVVVAGK